MEAVFFVSNGKFITAWNAEDRLCNINAKDAWMESDGRLCIEYETHPRIRLYHDDCRIVNKLKNTYKFGSQEIKLQKNK